MDFVIIFRDDKGSYCVGGDKKKSLGLKKSWSVLF